MATDDEPALSVSGTAHLGDLSEVGSSDRLLFASLAAVTAALVGVTALTAVETGNATVGGSLVGAAVLAVLAGAALEATS